MRTKHKAAVLAEENLAHERIQAFHDARALAIELACGQPSARIDPMRAGVVLQPGESVYRELPLWIRMLQHGCWAEASFADVLVTDTRLLCRLATGRVSLWWSGVVGIDVDLTQESMVLDYGDGQPVSLAGPCVGSAAVAGVAMIYGTAALIGHPGLAALRPRGLV